MFFTFLQCKDWSTSPGPVGLSPLLQSLIHTHTYAHIHTYTQIHKLIYIDKYTHIHTCTQHAHTHILMHTYTHINTYIYTRMQMYTPPNILSLTPFFPGLRGNHKIPSHQTGVLVPPWAMVFHEKHEFKGNTRFLEQWALPQEIITRPQFAFSGPWELLQSDRFVQWAVGQKGRLWNSTVPKWDPGQIWRALNRYKISRSIEALTFYFAGIEGLETK